MTAKLDEIDVLLNKHALRKARLEKLLEDSGVSFGSSDAADRDLERQQDEELRHQSAELGGLGFKSKDVAEDLKSKAASSDERLRRQLLGKNATSFKSNASIAKDRHGRREKHKIKHARGAEAEDSDDEGGRTSSFKSKKDVSLVTSLSKKRSIPLEDARNDDDGGDGDEHDESQRLAVGSKKHKVSMSYLDEILDKKARKKKRKKNAKTAD